jgi:hypothetical protein
MDIEKNRKKFTNTVSFFLKTYPTYLQQKQAKIGRKTMIRTCFVTYFGL